MPCNAAYLSMVHKEYYSNEQTTIGFDRHNAFICKFKMRFLLVKVVNWDKIIILHFHVKMKSPNQGPGSLFSKNNE